MDSFSLLFIFVIFFNMNTFFLITNVVGEILNVHVYLEGRVIKNLLRLWCNLHHVFCFEMLLLKRNILFRWQSNKLISDVIVPVEGHGYYNFCRSV